MGKQIRVSEKTHRLLEALSKKQDQSLASTTTQALALFHTVIERMERKAGADLVIKSTDGPDEVIVLPVLVHSSEAPATDSEEAAADEERPGAVA